MELIGYITALHEHIVGLAASTDDKTVVSSIEELASMKGYLRPNRVDIDTRVSRFGFGVSIKINSKEHDLMGGLEIFAIILMGIQVVFTIQVIKNYRYALSKYRRPRVEYRPKCALIVPCKGLDAAFEINIRSFFCQDYENYELIFVVEDDDDPVKRTEVRLLQDVCGIRHVGLAMVDLVWVAIVTRFAPLSARPYTARIPKVCKR